MSFRLGISEEKQMMVLVEELKTSNAMQTLNKGRTVGQCTEKVVSYHGAGSAFCCSCAIRMNVEGN